ncbi:Rhamnogalacturonan II Xylosyl transferase-like protein [Selaginella moellendorffii]|uniref:Glycosyltransferase n=1 Tax=Selaginella moellendorffii TaxID=88036 RepID=D8R9V3_SELML|nr:UDP-D-xylose:L-fucose alpha-1,3-D-xylosyltransferase MGP4 [Selaginella moellendorffii]EFJ30957.1 Rhamnogalacturonan II Xylosyl transferase-like protein [Selaginella moellendorffii]|eukprot:XP_002967610.1 UDP-D-xylose:L-fucose alpha-1,3-D-xylosyltransferase MGP4 [Selaginella moellendorffii]
MAIPGRRALKQGALSWISRRRLVTLVLGAVLLAYILVSLQDRGYRAGSTSSSSRWADYTLEAAAAAVARDGRIVVCAVSFPYLAFLVNWLISIASHGHHDKVLVIAEDYEMLNYVNEFWPGHAVLVPPALPLATAQRFGSQGFFNFTSRRPQHLLKLLELGYSVLYNDVDMVWMSDPFPLFTGDHDIYFTDDMTAIKPLDHSHSLPPPGKKGRTYICSCMIFLRPTPGAKLVLQKWIEELQQQPWSPKAKANDQPAFNWALNKTSNKVDMYLLPQASFPSGGLYFKNETWRRLPQNQNKLTIIHNNYITGFDKKIKRFHDTGLWLIDDAHVNTLPDFNLVKHYLDTQPQL